MPPGDILIFMTGQEDIEATCFVLADRVEVWVLASAVGAFAFTVFNAVVVASLAGGRSRWRPSPSNFALVHAASRGTAGEDF